MTDELNELASAYVDGETTPEETAWVENDDQAQTVVDNIRLLSSRVKSVPPQAEAKREQHISAALAAFDIAASNETVVVDRRNADSTQKVDLNPNNIVPLVSKSRSEPNDRSGNDDTGFTDPNIQGLVGNVVPISSKPQYRWLTPLAGAAALVLVLGAGFTLIKSQSTFTGSSDEASSSAVATADSAVAAEAPNVEQQTGGADDAAEEDTEAAEEAAEAEAADGLTDQDFASESDEESVPKESLARNESGLLTFDVLPDKAELETIGSETELSTSYEPSSCAANASDPLGGTLIGFIPISVGGTPGELLVFTSETSRRGVSVSAVDSQCELLS